MAWFDRMKKREKEDELPKELEGKTAEEVVALLKTAEENKTKLATLEADRVKEREQVAALSSNFDQVKAKLASTEANLNKLQNPERKEEPADWNIDPEKAFQQNVAPLVNVVVQNASMSARLLAVQSLDNEDTVSPTDARTMNGRLFRAWEAEINEEAKKYPVASMGQPQSWIGIYYLVKGRHADELANPETRKKKYNFVESAAQGSPPQKEKEKEGVEALTDQEKHVADKMHVSYENYAKRKKAMHIIQG